MIEVNALGKRCPAPIIDLAKAMKDLSAGEILTLKSDDPATWADLSAWSRMTSHSVEQIDQITFRVGKK